MGEDLLPLTWIFVGSSAA